MSDDTRDLIAQAAESAAEVPDLRPSSGDAHADSFDAMQLPDDCPVTPLGHLQDKIYFLDYRGQIRTLGSEMRKGELMLLFGTGMGWLDDVFPQYKNIGGNTDKNPPNLVKDGFNQTKAQRALLAAAAGAGLFDPAGKVRGRGSHKGANGEIILHCGDRLLIGGRKGARGQARRTGWEKPGVIGRQIYSTAAPLPHPAEKPAEAKAGRALLGLLSLWPWSSGVLAAVDHDGRDKVPIEALLVLGFIGCAKVCGAIGWRPHVWVVGPSGAGKSTFQELVSRLLADWALESQDPSEAWISQSLMDQRLPVLYDEPEPTEDQSSYVRKVIALARLASSGGKKGRGSSDHKAMDFAIFSCFLFSSIVHHELEQQDRNRMAVLGLRKFAAGTAALGVDDMEAMLANKWGVKMTLRDLGLAFTRRLVEQWGRYEATRGSYQAELMRHGADPRAQNTYGELLAMADLMLFDSAPENRLDLGDINEADPEAESRCGRLVSALEPMLRTASAEAENTADRCLGRLSQFRLTAAAGKHQETVGRWIERAMVAILMGVDGSAEARNKLRSHGMKLVHVTHHAKAGEDGETIETIGAIDAYLDPDPATGSPIYLAVGNRNSEALRQIFANTSWKGGEWQQALRMIDGAVQQAVKIRFDGPPQYAALVPINAVVDLRAVREEANLAMASLADLP